MTMCSGPDLTTTSSKRCSLASGSVLAPRPPASSQRTFDSSTSANTGGSMRWDGCGHRWQVIGSPNPTTSAMSHMTEDCVFCGLAGETIEGEHSSVRRTLLPDSPTSGKGMPEARWHDDDHTVCGDRGLSHWRLHGATPTARSLNPEGATFLVRRRRLVETRRVPAVRGCRPVRSLSGR